MHVPGQIFGREWNSGFFASILWNFGFEFHNCHRQDRRNSLHHISTFKIVWLQTDSSFITRMPCWTGNRIGFNSKKLDVFLQKHTFLSFLTNNKTTVNVNFTSTTGKLYALIFQTLSCPKWSKLKNTWSYFCLLIQALTNESWIKASLCCEPLLFFSRPTPNNGRAG